MTTWQILAAICVFVLLLGVLEGWQNGRLNEIERRLDEDDAP